MLCRRPDILADGWIAHRPQGWCEAARDEEDIGVRQIGKGTVGHHLHPDISHDWARLLGNHDGSKLWGDPGQCGEHLQWANQIKDSQTWIEDKGDLLDGILPGWTPVHQRCEHDS